MAVLQRVTVFLRWLFTAERLPVAPEDSSGAIYRCRSFIAWALTGEELAEGPCDPPASILRRTWLEWILSPGHLPLASETGDRLSAGTHSFWRRLLAREELPQCSHECALTPLRPVAIPREGGVLSYAPFDEKPQIPCVNFFRSWLSRDVCPQFGEVPHRKSDGFWRWVFSSETCPRIEEPPGPRSKGFWQRVVSPEQL